MAPMEGPIVNRLFCGGLPKGFEEEDVRSIFAPYGDILEVSIRSSHNDTFAFIQFAEQKEAEWARAKLDQSTVEGRRILVNAAKASNKGSYNKETHRGDDRRGGYSDDRRDDRDRERYNDRDREGFRGSREERHRGTGGPPPSRREIEDFLEEGQIDPAASEDFRNCPPDVQRMVLDQGELRSARKPSGALIIRIKKAREVCGSVYHKPDGGNDKWDRDDKWDRRDDGRGSDRWAKSRSRSPPRRNPADRPAIQRKGKHKVTIEGIPEDMGWQELKDMVRTMKLYPSFAKTSRQGRTCYAILEFEEFREADRAIAEMDNRRIEGNRDRLRAFHGEESSDGRR